MENEESTRNLGEMAIKEALTRTKYGDLKKTAKKFTHSLERIAIKNALTKTDGSLKEAANLLKMPYSTLNYKIRVLGLLRFAKNLRAEAVLRESDD